MKSQIRFVSSFVSVALAAGAAFGQVLEIDAFSNEGLIYFTVPPNSGDCRIEWSSDLETWHGNWDSLRHIQVGDNVSMTAQVPIYYRIASISIDHSIPEAVGEDDFIEVIESPERLELGKALFFDKILSGNNNISCATCHHPFTGTADGLPLSIGEGGTGIGLTRNTGRGDDAVHERVPRHAPHILNIGDRNITSLFADGRVAIDSTQPSGFLSPAGNNLPAGLENIVAVQAMFPVTSATEMAGQAGENSIADLAAESDLPGIWEAIAVKLREVPEYVELFQAAYPDIQSAADITYVHAANAIASFEISAWTFVDSPFDHYLAGDQGALTEAQHRGMELFYGKANCAECHQGALLTDQAFHAIGMPQLGPGKGHGALGNEDFGREVESGDIKDRYRFRTPTLRNITLTAPYGHNGAYRTLEEIVRHHLDPIAAMASYDPSTAFFLPRRIDLDEKDIEVYATRSLEGDANLWAPIAEANEVTPVDLDEAEFDALIQFLHALTDPFALDLSRDIPLEVPSGLPVFE